MESKGSKRARLVIADDHTLMVHGLVAMLEPGFEIVGTANDGRAVLDTVSATRPDAVLLDISMPLLNGFDAARQIHRQWPDTKIVFLTMHANRDYLLEAVRAGASGYLLKSSAVEEVAIGLRTVIKGGTYVTRELPEGLRSILCKRSKLRARPEGVLSNREREVLQLVAAGRTAKEIATTLGRSVKTVEYHKYKMMNKLGLHSTAELAAYAAKTRLLEFTDPAGLGSTGNRR